MSNLDKLVEQFKKIGFDAAIFVVLLTIFFLKGYDALPIALQLVALKALLVSTGILHAHIARKLIFPKIDWGENILRGKTYVAIAFYIIIPWCYAISG
jgi:hypothetical protein